VPDGEKSLSGPFTLSKSICPHLTTIEPLNDHPYDIVLLDLKNAIFCFRVIKEGLLVYARNPDRIADVIEAVSRRYAGVYPRYRAALFAFGRGAKNMVKGGHPDRWKGNTAHTAGGHVLLHGHGTFDDKEGNGNGITNFSGMGQGRACRR